jgi:predicted amidohydrolase
VTLGGGENYRESDTVEGGANAVVVEGPMGAKVGLTICYDVRFAGLYSALARGGAEIITAPAAFTVPTGQAHWETLLRARAIEAGLFVAAAAQCGTHEDGRSTYGHSLVVDPWGDLLLDMGEGNGIEFAEVDLGRISEVRGRVPALHHRRVIGEAVMR